MLTKLYLQHFRNHKEVLIDLDEARTLVVGPNGAGKTNLFEAITLLSTGNSFRASTTAEMIGFDSQLAHLGVVLTGSHLSESPTRLDATLTRGVLSGRRVAPKSFRLNQVGRTRKALTGLLPVVVFRPEDMRLIEGGPHRRRAWLDEILSQLFHDYQRTLTTYSGALLRRNKTLLMVRDGRAPVSALEYWNQLLVESGQVLSLRRKELVSSLNQTELLSRVGLELIYQNSSLSPARIEEYQSREIASGHTLIGPHRDELVVLSILDGSQEKRSVANYGSRGQERIAIAYLKLASAELLESTLGVTPLIMLDDIFSELDATHREWILSNTTKYQTIISTADPHTLEGVAGTRVELALETPDKSSV